LCEIKCNDGAGDGETKAGWDRTGRRVTGNESRSPEMGREMKKTQPSWEDSVRRFLK